MNAPFRTHKTVLPVVGRGPKTVGTHGSSAFTKPITRQGSGESATTATPPTTKATGNNGVVFVNHNARASPPGYAPQPQQRTTRASAADTQKASASCVLAAPSPPVPQPPSISSSSHAGAGRSYSMQRQGSTSAYGSPLVAGPASPFGFINDGSGIGGGGGGGGFGISGVRTGEEVVVSDIEKRQPRKVDMTDPNRDERRIKALQAEVKTLSEKLKKSQAAKLKQRDLFQLAVAELEMRREIELAYWVESHDGPAWHLSNSVARAAHTALAGNRSAFDKEVSSLQNRIAEFRTALDTEQQRHNAAAKAEEEAKKAAENARAEQNRSEVERLKAQLAEQRTQFARDIQEKEANLAQTQEKLRQSDESKRKLAEKIAEDLFLLAQCRLFVKNVCQPGFNVVKGVGLEPVDKQRTEPTGFVLVPLIVLLHGYTLLPASDRKEVIDHYESEAAALVS